MYDFGALVFYLGPIRANSLFGKSQKTNEYRIFIRHPPRIDQLRLRVAHVHVDNKVVRVTTMPEILLAFSHGFTEVWHYDQIAASRSIFLLDLSTRTTVPYSCIRSRKFVPPSTTRVGDVG